MSKSVDSAPAMFESIRRMGSTLMSMFYTRLALAGVELAEEKARLLHVALLALSGLLFAGLALVTLTVLIVLWFWDGPWRWYAFVGVTLVYALAGFCCAYRAHYSLRNAPPLFEATLAELDKDREMFRQ